MKKSLILWAVLFILLLVGATVGYRYLSAQYQQEQEQSITTQETQSTEQPKQKAPDFVVIDGDRNAQRLSKLQGKPVVVNFWATWCGPCKMELPAFDAMYKKYREQVVFLMVNLTDGQRETFEGAKAFVAENGYTFPTYYDTKSNAANAYGIRSVPLTVFITPDGTLLGGFNGAIDEATLEAGILKLLEES